MSTTTAPPSSPSPSPPPSATTLALVRILIPQLPYVFKTALRHTLGYSPTSYKWSLKTELIISLVRRLLDPRIWGSISLQQAFSLKGEPIKGRMWVAKTVLEAPAPGEGGEEILRVLREGVEGLKRGEGNERMVYEVPKLQDVSAEWHGYRAGVDSDCPRPAELSELQHYERLMEEVASHVTILYFHGGAFYLCDPSTHRPFTTKLARLTRGRCLSVRYRLSPQHAFPSALLDCFLAYLTLLSPPPGSFHAPVDPSRIVISGDSCGGNLALSLLQLLLHLNRTSPSATIRLHGRDVPLAIPAGVATNSAWTDLTRCLPSSIANLDYDYLTPPLRREEIARFPSCTIWPTEPLRGDLYCDISMLCHPLASPVITQDWRGSCPLWFCYGEETLLDEGKIIAARAAKQGVQVIWEEWEAMPHVFAQILTDEPAAKKCYENWAAFCTAVVEKGAKGIETKGTRFAIKTMAPSDVDVRSLAVMSDEELEHRMLNAAAKHGEDRKVFTERVRAKI